MKKYLVAILAVLSLMMFAPQVKADGVNNSVDCSGAPQSSFCTDREHSANASLFGTGNLFGKVIEIITVLTGTISVFIMVWGGLKFVNSGGDSSKVANAKNTILYASIGIAVALLSQSIISFVINKL